MATTSPVAGVDELRDTRSEGQWSIVLRRFRRHHLAMISLVVLLLILLAAFFAPYLTPFSPRENDITKRFLTPLTADPDTGQLHIFGTDNLGRDYFTRVLYAGRVSLTVALTTSTIAVLIGIFLGLLAGYFGGWIDIAITRTLEFISTFPLFIVLLILSSILLQNESLIPIPDFAVSITAALTAVPDTEARKVTLLVLALALLNWTPTARLMRGMVLSVREQVYIESSRALGASNPRIIWKHVFPNAYPPIIVDFTLLINTILVLESSLSFLGFGVQDPTPTWGNMLAFAQSNMFNEPWLPLVPGLPLLLCALAINFIGDGMRDALDPRLKL